MKSTLAKNNGRTGNAGSLVATALTLKSLIGVKEGELADGTFMVGLGLDGCDSVGFCRGDAALATLSERFCCYSFFWLVVTVISSTGAVVGCVTSPSALTGSASDIPSPECTEGSSAALLESWSRLS